MVDGHNEMKRGTLQKRNTSMKTLFFYLTLYILSVPAVPLTKSSRHPKKLTLDIEEGIVFLKKYGYLTTDGKTRSSKDVRDATKRFQQLYGLPMTGRLDERTLTLMKTPRCGLSDSDNVRKSGITIVGKPKRKSEKSIRKTYDINLKRTKRYSYVGRWPSTNITYGFSSFADGMATVEQQKAISHALDVWSQETPLSFVHRRQGDVNIMISFERGFHNDGYPFDGPGQTLAHAFFPGQGDRSGDIHFDADESWTYTSREGTSLFMVAVHEFGHALGLGHSPSPGSVMLPFYQGYKDNIVLGEDDRMAVQHLYGGEIESQQFESPDEPSIFAGPTLTADSRDSEFDVCTINFDAVANIRKEIYFFKGNKFWRFLLSGERLNMATVGHFWIGYPNKKIDAVYSFHSKTRIFSGDQYWSFTDNEMDKDAPRPLSDFNLPMDGGIDGAFVWSGVNDGTYFFKGSLYWKYDERRKMIEIGYPKNISFLKGIPINMDAVFTDPKDKKVYFLKGRIAWQMNNNNLSAGNPQYIGHKWFGCPKEEPVFERKGTDIRPNTTKGQNHTTKASRGDSDNESVVSGGVYSSDPGNGVCATLVANVNLFICSAFFPFLVYFYCL